MPIVRAQPRLTVLVLALLIVVFACDLRSAPGTAAEVLYAAVVAVSLRGRSQRLTRYGATAATLFAAIGFALSSTGVDPWTAVLNRTLTITLLWAVAVWGAQRLVGTEAELRRRAVVTEGAAGAVMLADAQGRIDWVNEAFTKITGYEQDEAKGKRPLEILGGPSADPVEQEELRARIDSRRSFQTELLCRTKGGQDYWCALDARSIFNDEGDYQGWFAIGADVTERRRRHEKLKRSEKLLQQAGEMAKIGGWEMSLDGRTLRWSRELYRMHELSLDIPITPDDALGYYAPEARPVVRRAIRDALEKGKKWDLELPLTTAEGRRVWVRAFGQVELEDGRPVCLAGALQDITERKIAEDRLRHYVRDVEQSRSQLEQQAGQLRLQAEELGEAREAALESARIKSAFLANMSHEIRTPMNGILGMAALLADTPLSSEQNEYLSTINVSIESLLTVLNDILDLSKIEAGKLEFEETEFSIVDCVEQAADIIAADAFKKRLEVATFLDPSLPVQVIGDPLRLRQVLVNLLGNAVKFTEQGAVRLKAGLETQDGDEALLRVAVHDTGIGVAAERLDGVFEAFTQADESAARRFGGSGLGLAISRQLAEGMGGEIGVNSVVGEGSEFWFTVRLRVKAAPCGTLSLAGATLLLVSDSAALSGTASETLRAAGANVVCVTDWRAAQAKLRGGTDNCYRTVLLDLDLPSRPSPAETQAGALGIERKLILIHSKGGRDASAIDAYRAAAALARPLRRERLLRAVRFEVVAAGIQDARPISAEPVISAGPALRVLLAEDNPVNQKVALRILAKLGYDADLACDGREAVEALQRTPYDLVLMDCQMPKMDGFEATRAIRALESGVRSVPVIALTANAMKGDRDRCLEAGMNDYLTKPITAPLLGEALRRWS